MTLIEYLRPFFRRERNHMTQKELSEHLHVHQATVSNHKKNGIPPERISDYEQVTNYIINRVDCLALCQGCPFIDQHKAEAKGITVPDGSRANGSGVNSVKVTGGSRVIRIPGTGNGK